MNNYQTFGNFNELPKERTVTVVIPSEEDTDAILVGNYQNGNFLKEPSYLGPVELTDHLGNYLSEDREVYVQEEAEHAYKLANEYSKIFIRCSGNLEKISEALDEHIECLAFEAECEMLDDEFMEEENDDDD